jgi:N-acetylmuramoyl-L-alanine amidase
MIPRLVILHCADTPDYPENHKDFDRFGLVDVDLWHKQRGFKKVGYHYIIRKSGRIEKGRKDTEQGAHCKANGGNIDSIGICLIGRNVFTDAQMNSLYSLYLTLLKEHDITSDQWHGHYEFEEMKTCPNIDMVSLRERLSTL